MCGRTGSTSVMGALSCLDGGGGFGGYRFIIVISIYLLLYLVVGICYYGARIG